MTRMRTTTKRTRWATSGSPHEEEDTRFAPTGKSLPTPAFVSKTPQHQGLFSIVALCTRPEVWKTAPCPPNILVLHTVVWEEGCCVLFLFRQGSGWLSWSLLPSRESCATRMWRLWDSDRAGSPHLVNVQDAFRLPTPVVIPAWFPALRCLSAFLVSCRCRGKHTTLYFLLPYPPPLVVIIKNSFFISLYLASYKQQP